VYIWDWYGPNVHGKPDGMRHIVLSVSFGLDVGAILLECTREADTN